MTPRIFLYDIRLPGTSSGPSYVGIVKIQDLQRYIERQVKEITDEVYHIRRDFLDSENIIEPSLGISALLGAVDHLVVRLDARIDWSGFPELINDILGRLKARHKRNPETAHWLLSSSKYEHRLKLAWSPEHQPTDPVAVLNAIKLAELDAVLEDEQVIYHHSRAAFFRLPSGELSDFFLRVGNLQRRSRLLEMVAFWSLPFLKNCTHILAETWSISTTAAYLAEFLRNYDSSRNFVSWSYLGAYLPSSLEEQRRLKVLTKEVHCNGGQMLVLISASSTGKLRKLVFDLTNEVMDSEWRFKKADTLTLLTIRSDIDHGNIVHDASRMLESNGLQGIFQGSSEKDSNIIEINPETYFPDYRLRQAENFSAVKHPEPTRGFFENYSGHGIFCVCRKGRTHKPDRHHSFYVDFLKLNSHPAFLIALKSRIQEIGEADIVIARDDSASLEFLSTFKSVHLKEFGENSFKEFVVSSFSDVSNRDSIANALTGKKNTVVFLDPVYITGGHVRDLAIAVRNNVTKGKPPVAKMRHLVGLFRPETEIKVRYGRQFYPRMSNHDGFDGLLLAVEELKLPNWNETKCPWVIELRKHENLFADPDLSAAERAYIEARINSISTGMTNGLRGDDVFFRRYPHDKFRFFYGSFFLDSKKVIEKNSEFGITLRPEDIDNADIVCSVAAAFQEWREANKNRRPAFYQLRPLSPIGPEIVGDQNGFNEPALRAAIWRCLKINEIALDQNDNDLATTLAHIFLSNDENEHRVLGGEAALAFGNELMRLLGDATFDKIDWAYLKRLATI